MKCGSAPRTVRRTAASASAASWASTRARRCCRAPTTTTCRSFRRRDYVVMHNEMVHNARDRAARQTPTGTLPQWNGDSRGRWEGDTLVVETKNFLERDRLPELEPEPAPRPNASRGSTADTLFYEFTVNDPTTWTKPWTAQIPMTRSRRADVPVRLPRGELRDDEPAERREVSRDEQVGRALRLRSGRAGRAGQAGAPAATPTRGHANPR